MDIYKRKLEEYKEFETQRCKNFKDFYSKIKEQVITLHQSFAANIWEMTKNMKQNMGNVLPYIRGNLSDRYQVIDSMLSSLIQCAVPMSHRYVMYLALKGSDAASEIHSFSNSSPSEDFVKASAQLKVDAGELLKIGNLKSTLKNSALRIRGTIDKLLAHGKKLQSQVTNFDQYIFSKLIPNLHPNSFTNFIKWVNIVNLNNILDYPER